MPDFLRDAVLEFQTPAPLVVFLRLVAALALGAVVALVYRTTRPAADVAPSFTATLVLLSILIAMVTQVIGDNVARAFSLVGALSIVRFRTVVRDTQDTAYVIFAVGVGMAAGAGNHWVGVGGIAVVAVAALVMRRKDEDLTLASSAETLPFELQVRLGIGHDPHTTLGPTLGQLTGGRRLMSIATARQGIAVDATYRIALPAEETANALVVALNRIEGVQSVALQRVPQAQEGTP
jgi:uncharacterized membrane protein YhiD involved in acid resistance